MKKLSSSLLALFCMSMVILSSTATANPTPYEAPLGTESLNTYDVIDHHLLPRMRNVFYTGSEVNVTGQGYRPSRTVYVQVERLNPVVKVYSQAVETSSNGVLSHVISNSSSFLGGTYNVTAWNGDGQSRQLLSQVVFGVWGPALATYHQGEVVEIAGGGLSPSSQGVLTISPEGTNSSGYAVTFTATSSGDFKVKWYTTAEMPSGVRTIRLFGVSFKDGETVADSDSFNLEQPAIRLDLNVDGSKKTIGIRRGQVLNITVAASFENGTILRTGSVRLLGESLSKSGIAGQVSLGEVLFFDSATSLWRKLVTVPVGFSLGDMKLYSVAQVGNLTGSTASQPIIAGVEPAILNIQSLRTSSRRYYPGETVKINFTGSYYPGSHAVSVGFGSVVLAMPNGTTIRLQAGMSQGQYGAQYRLSMDAQVGAWSAYASISDPFGNSINATSVPFTVEQGLFYVHSEVSRLEAFPGDIVRIEAMVTYANGTSVASSSTKVSAFVTDKIDSMPLTLDSSARMYRGEIDTSNWEAGTYDLEISATATGFAGSEMLVFNVRESPFPLGTIVGGVIVGIAAVILVVYYLRRRRED